ncbi:hypothetical protein CsSME_00048574 [Camellia sinensis var. sinensis]
MHTSLVGLLGVLCVRPDLDFNSAKMDYGNSEVQLGSPLNKLSGSTLLFPVGKSKHWLVRMDKLAIGVVTKAQIVDYYTQLLTKVMGTYVLVLKVLLLLLFSPSFTTSVSIFLKLE